MPTLLASAPSLEQIGVCIRKFYCGSDKTLVPVSDNEWRVARKDNGAVLELVRVVRKRGRYRFEALANKGE